MEVIARGNESYCWGLSVKGRTEERYLKITLVPLKGYACVYIHIFCEQSILDVKIQTSKFSNIEVCILPPISVTAL